MNKSKLILMILWSTFAFPAVGQQIDSVKSGAVTIYFEVYGEGQPIYLLTGGPGISPYGMREMAAELAKSHQAVLVHQRGTGQSKVKANEETITIDNYCLDLKGIKNHLMHKKISLLGHSWGGMLAMQYSVKYPDDVARIVLVSSGGYNLNYFNYFGDNIFSRLSKDDQSAVEGIERFYAAMDLNPENAKLKKELGELMVLYQSILLKAYVYDKRAMENVGLKGDEFNAEVLQLMMGSLAKSKWDLKDQLGKIKAPTLIVQGRQDPLDLETARGIEKMIKGSKLLIVEKCGHFAWFEQREQFYKAVNDFMESPRGPQPSH